MDTQSLIYFVESAKDLNFTKTAARLFISQQNLSNHISRLEQHYGVSLYDRKPRLTLTYAGETLLRFALQYKMDEENLRGALADIVQKQQGRLNIGCSPHRTSIAMPILAEKFLQKYPHIQLNFCQQHSNVLFDMMQAGELDFAIAVDKFDYPQFESIILFQDTVYLMVSRSLLTKYYSVSAEAMQHAPAQGIELKDYARLPFYNIKSAKLTRDVFRSCGCEPYFAVTQSYPQYSITGNFENIAASIITKTVYLHLREHVSPDIIFLPIHTPDSVPVHSISFVHNQQKYLSVYGKYFQQLTIDYFHQLLDADTLHEN